MSDEVSRCTGHCCKDFDFDIPPEQFERWKKLSAEGKMCLQDQGKWCRNMNTSNNDLHQVSSMVQFVRADRQYSSGGHRSDKVRYHYTCKHFDGKNCTIYENRPQLCRRFPDRGECKIKGCTRKCAVAGACEAKKAEEAV